MIKLLLADDHTILREGLESLLSLNSELSVIGKASNGEEAVELAGKLKPDVILMDIGMPVLNGLKATRKIKDLYPEVKILILTQYESEYYFFSSLQAGSSGYILKGTNVAELISAVTTIHEGQIYFSPVLTQTILKNFVLGDKLTATQGTLSPRELEVLKLLADGCSNQEIADQLFVSVKTVQTHRYHLMEKLNLHSRTELVKYAIREGILILEDSER
ncbi:MAG: response regulator transcription factor [Firmicutes bacterium]|jgi:two-component system response regulator NreC|nr:response regulator transcription factor [Bacillota bacterium]